MFNFIFKKALNDINLSNSKKVDFSKNNQGIGPFLALYTVFKLLEQRKINFEDIVVVNETAIKEKGKGIVGYQLGDQLSLFQVLVNYKITSGVDSLFLLSNHVFLKTQKKMSDYFIEIINENNLSENCAKNLSGKSNSKLNQDYNLEDVLTISELFSKINPFYLNILSESKTYFKGKIFLAQSYLLDLNKITYFFDFLNISVSWKIEQNKVFSYVVTQGVENSFQQDSLIERVFLDEKINFLSSDFLQVDADIKKSNAIINLIGDTYLGEYYSARRSKRKDFFDPLINHGYSYSFGKLEIFLHHADINIANHEACFINQSIQSPLIGLKKFILGADDEKTITALEKANIKYLSLANNHTADYGEDGISHTLEILNKHNIKNFGAGLNELDACKPLRVKINGRVISFYAGYWHRATNQKIFKFYATPSEPGVATLESILTESIKAEKTFYPDHTIIVLSHWGVDFLPTQNYQKHLANKLIQCGADLIVGHGAHALQSIEDHKGKTVLYSIGNGIFNSDGEYEGYPDAMPFGMIAQLNFDNSNMSLKLFPIDSNNRETMWQPDFVNLEQFSVVQDYYSSFNFDSVNTSEWPFYFEKRIINF